MGRSGTCPTEEFMTLVRTNLLTFAAVVLAGYPGAARAQLFFQPNPVAFTISAPGQVAGPITVGASSPSPISSVTIAGATTSDGSNWLCVVPNTFNSVNVFIGTGGCSNTGTSQLAVNGSYSAQVTIQANGGALIGNFGVSLQVGNGSGGAGLAANPVSVSFTENIPGQPNPASQTVSATLNGSPIAITGANFTPNSGVPAFINTSFNNGTVILTVNNQVSTQGTYQGTETLVTNSGNINVPVLLTFGGGSGSLTVSQNPVNFNVQTNGTATPQNVTVSSNGAPVPISSVASSIGWLLPSFQSNVAGNINVGVNASGLSPGIYNGIVTVVTPQGQVSFQVNLTVAGIPTLNANPAALNFAYQIGTNFPLSQTISVTSNGTAANFSVSPSTSSGGGQWLVVSPTGGNLITPTQLTVSVNPANLFPGTTYQGNIQLNTFGGSTNSVINIPISLLVSSNPILVPNPASLSFTASVGGNGSTQNLQLSSSSTPLNYTVTSSVTSPAGSTWLQVPTQVGTTPGVVNVPVNLFTVPGVPGTYNATITATAPSAANSPVTVPVTLTITPGATLQLSPASLFFAYQIGQSPPATQSITVTSNTGTVNYTVSTQTNSGQAWLSTSAANGTTPGNFAVSVNTSGLTSGTYDGTVTVTAANSSPQTIAVRLIVSTTALLAVSPGSLTFSIPAGSGASSFQNLAVTSTDGSPINFNVAAATSTGANWLLASATSGTTASNLTFSANPNGLAIGAYTGTITITATTPNVADSPRTIAVTLNITPAATLAASATSLSFSQTSSGSAPPSQTVTVSATGAQIAFAANVTLFQGLNWLTVSPASATASPSNPVTLTVTANGSGLGPGTYNGQIALSSPGAANAVIVNVTFTVSNAPTITVSPASLAPVSFQIGGANPATQTLTVSIFGGGAVAFSAAATTASGGNWLSVSPGSGTTGQGSPVTVAVSPAGLLAGSYQGTVTITVAGATNSPVTLPITLTVIPSPVTAPTVAAIQNAASSAPTSLAPGLNILIYGANMGPSTLVPYQVGANGVLLTLLVGTQVTFDGIPAPVIFTRDTLVSVMVPYEIAGRISSAMVVSYNGVPSTPLQLRVVDTAPAIYSANSSGSGQGAILNENFSVNSPSNPESIGHYIQIYGTGEGQTSPQGVNGLITSTSRPLPVPILPVAVTIGGLPVPASDIAYAGEAPLNVSGVIQVNAKIPNGVAPGPVPVVVIIGGVPSQANLTVSVR